MATSPFDQKVYKALARTDELPDEYKAWLPKYLRYQSSMQVTKQQLPGVMGEIFKNVGDTGNPAFVSPWRHYAAGVSANGKVRFYKDYLGIVHLDGLAETTGTPVAASNIFVLPAGYCPTQAQMIFVQGYIAGAYAPTRLDILATGGVQVANPAPTAFVSGSFVSLANIHFRAG